MMNKDTNKSIPTMTDNERARLQGFKNFLEKKQKKSSEKKQNQNDKIGEVESTSVQERNREKP